ncbi:MAG: transporter substrate-binding domain-containing protein [Chitinispirillia bacterium]|nr:transporter substrate-binding domain-containing protein [Chitinispirillia bacterium]
MYRRKARLPLTFFAAALPAVVLAFVIIGCLGGNGAGSDSGAGSTPVPLGSYREIPGITEAEIADIEALKERYADSVLFYGMIYSTEAFIGKDSAVSGYTALVSRYMSDLFGLNIRPAIYEWGDLLTGLKSGKVSFTGDMTPSETRRQAGYYMTHMPIATRSIGYFRLESAEPMTKIKRTRKPRYGFLDGTTTVNAVISTLPYEVDTVFVHNYNDAYSMLQDGQVDAFFDESNAEAAFSPYNNVVKHAYLPLIYEPASLTTQQPNLASIISAMDKLQKSGGLQYLNYLYSLGEREYMLYNMYSKLTEEERAYVNRKPIVRLAVEYDNYPISFYNENESQWQGIALEVLKEVENLTGITFKVSNDKTSDFEELKGALERGHASVITELIRTSERDERFIWPHTPTMESRYALISKAGHRNIKINEILQKRVGIHKSTAYAEQFRNWFPNHPGVVEYTSTIDMFEGLERGEIDLAMSSQAMILAVTNYMERPGYKINVLFDHAYESLLGFNKNEAILCSIVDKALQQIELGSITELWMHKTYDYRIKLVQSRYPLFITVSLLLLCVVILLSLLFRNTRNMEKKLLVLVEKRTAELEKQNKLMEAVTQNYKGVIWSVDKDGVITMFDGRYLRETLHLEPSFLVGKNISLARERNRHLNVIDNVEKSLREGPLNWLSNIDGGTFRSSTTPIRDADGNIVGLAGSTDDITEMVRLSDDLEAALEAAKTASRAKSAFLANMSHEIRTPMNSVIGFSELSLDYEMSDKPREYIGKILENSRWLLQIINDILDVSKIEAGKMTLESIPFDLHEIFVLCRTATIPKAQEKGLMLHFYAEPFVGRSLVGDPTRLRQIFINLISNAIKFTNIGTVKVSATVCDMGDNDVSVHFEVRDSGIGMTADEMKKVLEPFAQADHSTTRRYGGTGLGLSIIKSFVEMMGGSLVVESTPGVGTKFSFDIRFKTVEMRTEAMDAGADIDGKDVERPMFEGEVLVCEDNHMNQEVVRRHLERVGLTAVIAENGKAGVEMVKARKDSRGKPFAMIFMDINMPVMDGLEASALIMELNTGIPVVAMTANVMSSDRELYHRSGMHDCVGKPFTSQELWRCLLRHIKPVKSVNQDDPSSHYDDGLLTELRTIFVNSNQRTFGDFVSAVNSGDVKLANRLAHTLKSNAGSIGKSALQKAAAEAEKLLADGRNSLSQENIDKLERELNAVLRELAPLFSKDDASWESAPQTGAAVEIPFAGELDALLRKGSPDCLKFTEQLRAIGGCERLVKQIENFDFDDAAATFAALRKNTERSNG